MKTYETPDYAAVRKQLIDENKLTIDAVFVPFSQSRNKDKKDRDIPGYSLNWRVTLKKDGREIVTTDYSAGFGHCPSYKRGARRTLDYAAAIKYECENGYAVRQNSFGYTRGAPIKPDAESVLWSLVLDSGVLEHSTFEEWAHAFGYDVDSRSAEKTYRDCIEIALKVRNGLGDRLLSKLREAFTDY